MIFSGLVSFLLNSSICTLFVYNRRKLLKSNDNKFLCSMTVADMFVGLFGMLYGVLLKNNVIMVYKIAAIIPLFSTMFASIASITGITVNRFIAVNMPLQYHSIVTSKRLFVSFVVIWVIPIFVYACQVSIFMACTPSIELQVRSIMTVAFFAVGSLALSVPNCFMYVAVRRQVRMIKAHISLARQLRSLADAVASERSATRLECSRESEGLGKKGTEKKNKLTDENHKYETAAHTDGSHEQRRTGSLDVLNDVNVNNDAGHSNNGDREGIQVIRPKPHSDASIQRSATDITIENATDGKLFLQQREAKDDKEGTEVDSDSENIKQCMTQSKVNVGFLSDEGCTRWEAADETEAKAGKITMNGLSSSQQGVTNSKIGRWSVMVDSVRTIDNKIPEDNAKRMKTNEIVDDEPENTHDSCTSTGQTIATIFDESKETTTNWHLPQESNNQREKLKKIVSVKLRIREGSASDEREESSNAHKKARMRLAENVTSVVGRIQLRRRKSKQMQKDNMHNTLVCVLVVVAFVICWSPLSIYRLRFILGEEAIPWLRRFALFLAAFNSIVNPCIYLLKQKALRRRIKMVLCRRRHDHNRAAMTSCF